MNKKKNRIERQIIAPKLRFPKFKKETKWEALPGNKLFRQISNKRHNSNLPILAITQEYGATPRDRINYHVSVTEQSIESYKVVEKGDFIISLRSFQGGIEYSKYKGLCSPAYIILRKKGNILSQYFKHFFKTERFIRDLNKNIEGLRDGKMVSYKQFSELMLPLPQSKDEQQSIADCLSAIDELLELESQKLDSLRNQKKGMMYKLFSFDGKGLPLFRFPEFRNKPAWEEKSLGQYISQRTERNAKLKHNLVLSVSNKKGFISQAQQFDDYRVASSDLSTYKIVYKDDIAYNPSRINVGSIAQLTNFKVGVVSPMYIVFHVKKELNPYFFLSLLGTPIFQQKIKDACMGGVRDVLSFTSLADFKFYRPGYDEQQKIADCLSSIDELIAAQEEKFEKLKEHKKGLLQQLFPSYEEIAL